jgi:hypothetical protein
MSLQKQLVKTRISQGLLIPEDIPSVADPLSGVYMQYHHPSDDELTLVALRINDVSGVVEGKIDGIFPRFVHAKFPFRICGSVPPVGDAPSYMLKTAVQKAMMYGRRWARDDGYREGGYIVLINPALQRFFIDPLQKDSQEWDYKLPDRLSTAWLYTMTQTPDGKTISKETENNQEKRYFLPKEKRKFVSTINEAVGL